MKAVEFQSLKCVIASVKDWAGIFSVMIQKTDNHLMEPEDELMHH